MPRRKEKKRRKQRHWDNDSVERLQKRVAGLEVERKKVAAKLVRLQDRDREIVEEYRDHGAILSIAESHGLSRSAVYRIILRHCQSPDVGQRPHSEPGLTTATTPVEEPSPSADGGALDDDLDDGAEQTSRASEQDYEALREDHEALGEDHEALQEDHEALRKDHEDLQDEYDELLGAIEEWMRRLRQQARLYRTRDVTSAGGSETEGSAAGRFLTDLAWDMETCIR